jgi:hypothetical protein
MAANGVIQKFIIDVNARDIPAEKHEVNAVLNLVKKTVIPRIKEQLEAFSARTDGHLVIDKLELDLGSFSEEEVGTKLAEVVQEVFKKQLQKVADLAKAEEKSPQQIAAQKSEEITVTKRDAFVELVEYFLTKGAFPWWSNTVATSLGEIESLWREAMSSPEAPKRFKKLFDALLNDGVMQRRAVRQFTPDLIGQWVLIMRPNAKNYWDVAERVIATVSRHSKKRPTREQVAVMREKTVQHIITLGDSQPTSIVFDWLSDNFDYFFKGNSALDDTLQEIVALKKRSKPMTFSEIERNIDHHLTSWIEHLNVDQSGPTTENNGDSNRRKKRPKSTNQEDPKPRSKKANGDLEPATDSEKTESENEEFGEEVLKSLFGQPQSNPYVSARNPYAPEEVYVFNAGIALLGPFLPHFMGKLGLLENSKWKSAEAQLQAIHVLYYIVNHLTDPTEEQLFFPKLLCGWPLEEPLPEYQLENTDLIDEECEILLKVLHSKWDMMKNSTWPGLQVNYLRRDGKLQCENEQSWKLIVEPAGQDVTLKFAEWSFSLLRYSWMEQMIFVQWGT